MDLLRRLGVDLPVVQAGMGGGIARHELAAAVSEAGGLGTLGLLPPDRLEAEYAAAKERTARPVAINLLLPFARRAHWRTAARADVVVTFWGAPKRRTGRPWVHQCGSVEEARAAHAATADAVIVQGVEAGGHVRGSLPALELLERARAALPASYPILLAGGIADAADVRAALDAGAQAAVAGTRFVMTDESGAHPGSRDRVRAARETVLTVLFGAGWPVAPHRVIPNAATERWLDDEGREPGWIRAVNRATGPLASRMPAKLQRRLAAAQRPGTPLLSPQPPSDEAPESLLDAGPLYAGQTVARIADVRPAAEVTRRLAP